MKRSLAILLPLLFVLGSCGTSYDFSSQMYQDGIYQSSQPKPAVLYTQEEFDEMARQNIEREQMAKRLDTLVIV